MPHDDIKFQRVAPDDPTRCQSTHNDQQCPYKAVEGSKYCSRHHGVNAEPRAYKNKYLVAKFQERIGHQANHPQIKNLSDEIAILRMTLEARLNACQEDMELLIHGNQITQLVQNITVAVEKWHKIEMSTNVVMDRTQALDFIHALSDILFTILSKALPAEKLPDILKQISEAMVEELGRRTDYSIRSK